ncbi:MAG: hypothetical protein J6I52_02630 [Prevotella sp.]|nr:hypothetical protein [Prevotella sp.]
MKKKVFLMLPCIAAVAIATVVGKKICNFHSSHSNLLMENVEALAQQPEANRLYAIVEKKSVEIIDEATGVQKKMVVIDCEGNGLLECA